MSHVEDAILGSLIIPIRASPLKKNQLNHFVQGNN